MAILLVSNFFGLFFVLFCFGFCFFVLFFLRGPRVVIFCATLTEQR